jgi:hypothetical protein
MVEKQKLDRLLRDRAKCRERLEPDWQSYREDQPDCVRERTNELARVDRQFTPWVGNNYRGREGDTLSSFGARVLVVGDSTYLGWLPKEEFHREYANDKEDWFNKLCVFQYRSGCWLDAYWTMWTDALLSTSLGEINKDRQPARPGYPRPRCFLQLLRLHFRRCQDLPRKRGFR